MIKVMKTDSDYCEIIIKKEKKYIKKYNRNQNELREYYRSTPEVEILTLLNQNNIITPKIIKQTKKYFLEEYIEGDLLKDLYPDHKKIDQKIIDEIIKEIYLLMNIDANSLLKYTSWHDNQTFYLFQTQNTLNVIKQYYDNLKELYTKLDLSEKIIEKIITLALHLDNNRPLSLIHGDRHKKNAFLAKDKKLIFIDWELGCVGDIAYELAFHLHQMAYTKEDEKYFFKKLKEVYQSDYIPLKKDVEIYRLFVLARSTLYHVYWTDLIYETGSEEEKKKQLGHFMRRYNRLNMNPEFNLKPKTEEELDQIFQSFRKERKNEVIS